MCKLPKGGAFADDGFLQEPLAFTIGDKTVVPGIDEAVRGMKSRGRTPRGGEQDMHSQRFARLELVTERLEVTAKRDVDDFERSERAEAESSLRATAGAPAVASSTSKVEDDSSSRCRVS